MGRKLALVSVAVFTAFAYISGSGKAAQIGGTEFSVGNWSGSAYTSDQTGAFSHCVASAYYLNKTTVFVSLNRDKVWNIGFVNEDWFMEASQTKPVYLKFDDFDWKDYAGYAADAKFLMIDMGISGLGFAALFKKARDMQLRFDNFSYQFELKNTSRMMDRLQACVATYVPQARKEKKPSAPKKDAAADPLCQGRCPSV